jgi:DNA replication and repair protein RecF
LLIQLDDARSAAVRERVGRIRRLALSDFRSFERLDLEFDGRPVALTGANGVGKTNLLEAISLLGPGRGLRRARLEELSRIGGSGAWSVSARLSCAGDEIALGVGGVEGEGRRRCRVDGETAKGPSALGERVSLIWLTPAQDRLFVEGAADRRRFLDRIAAALDPANARIAAAYESAMLRRQRLLEDESADGAWIEALEIQMAEHGVALAASRRDTAGALAAAAAEDDGGVFPAADIALEGVIESALAHAPAAEVEEDFAARLRAMRRRDAAAGRALDGPHRSDFVVTHRGKRRAARLCSTGEQKALLIGLVLAGARALSLRPDAPPLVLLLDEIAAHLDERRRSALFDILHGLDFQCFMTGTDESLFRAWGARAQAFEVRDGAAFEIR